MRTVESIMELLATNLPACKAFLLNNWLETYQKYIIAWGRYVEVKRTHDMIQSDLINEYHLKEKEVVMMIHKRDLEIIESKIDKV